MRWASRRALRLVCVGGPVATPARAGPVRSGRSSSSNSAAPRFAGTLRARATREALVERRKAAARRRRIVWLIPAGAGNRFAFGLFAQAHHPFLFFIRERLSGTILFAGKLASPPPG